MGRQIYYYIEEPDGKVRKNPKFHLVVPVREKSYELKDVGVYPDEATFLESQPIAGQLKRATQKEVAELVLNSFSNRG